jgi:hypothetical protein
MTQGKSSIHIPTSPKESTIYLTHSNHAHPTINVITVIGNPTRKYSQKPILVSGLHSLPQ